MSSLIATRRVAVATALVAALLMGCDRRGFRVTDAPPRKTLSGVLVGGSMNGVDCAWVEEPSGRRVEVSWPDRWRTEFEPLAIHDQNGVLVIRGGDAVAIVGYVGEVGRHSARLACHSTPNR